MKFDGSYAMTIGGKAVAGTATFDVVKPATESKAAPKACWNTPMRNDHPAA